MISSSPPPKLLKVVEYAIWGVVASFTIAALMVLLLFALLVLLILVGWLTGLFT